MSSKKLLLFSILLSVAIFSGCHFEDVVPDNIATIKNNAFNLRQNAKRFLYTLYSYMPRRADGFQDPGLFAGGEIVFAKPFVSGNPAAEIARGTQNVSSPKDDFWAGKNQGSALYEGIRNCNIFLKNIESVPGMSEQEQKEWAAEAKFLKAYYLFYLLRMYGPVYLPKKLIPVSASLEEVHITRSPIDDCFKYIEKLLNEAAKNLPPIRQDRVANLGRIDKVIDLAVKAKVMVTAASPFYNGNKDYTGFKNGDGEELFDPNFDAAKWDSAAAAAKKAIDFANQLGFKLYYFNGNPTSGVLTDTTKTELNIRGSVTENWNSEILWADAKTNTQAIQQRSLVRGMVPEFVTSNTRTFGWYSVPLRIVNLFYTNHGVPIDQDKTWDYSDRFSIEVIPDSDRYNLLNGDKTVGMNMNRGPRFYADLGFDRGRWYGQGFYNEAKRELALHARSGESSQPVPQGYSLTGYWTKKLANYQSVVSKNSIHYQRYSWPLFRLTDLYLLYVEAKNEADGPGPEVYKYINLIRTRDGLPTVQKAWTTYSTNPNEYKTKEGMRKIIHRERRLSLAFEGQNFWALRRWKEAIKVFNTPVAGWSIFQSSARLYYKKTINYQQPFTLKDYLWPISEKVLENNPNLRQNPGW
jgi:hypothetical protein